MHTSDLKPGNARHQMTVLRAYLRPAARAKNFRNSARLLKTYFVSAAEKIVDIQPTAHYKRNLASLSVTFADSLETCNNSPPRESFGRASP